MDVPCAPQSSAYLQLFLPSVRFVSLRSHFSKHYASLRSYGPKGPNNKASTLTMLTPSVWIFLSVDKSDKSLSPMKLAKH